MAKRIPLAVPAGVVKGARLGGKGHPLKLLDVSSDDLFKDGASYLLFYAAWTDELV